MNLETEIAAMQEIRRQSLERFRQERWRRLVAMNVDGDGCALGDSEAFLAARAGAETFMARARWAFPLAVEAMGEVADAMGWPWLTPQRWTWRNFWCAEYLLGYATGKAHPAGSDRDSQVSIYTASVSIDLWAEGCACESDWVPELCFTFVESDRWLELTAEMVSDETAFREACAVAIVEAYREYALSDEFVPPV
jgi:hypothetical protein